MNRLLSTLPLVTAMALALPRGAQAQTSPFMRSAETAGAAEIPADADYELSGLISLGNTAMACITVLATQRSHWIKEGESRAGILILQLDAAKETVNLRQGGREITLGLKKPQFDPAQYAGWQSADLGAPLRSAGVAQNVALTNEEKETDARMLVSDLLDIGIIQRKAYQQAKQDQIAADREAAPKP